MSTVQQIIDGGFSKSSAARPESITEPAELVSRVGFCLREVFQIIARENPTVLGVTATMNWSGTNWPRPTDCLRAIKVVASVGTIAVPAIPLGKVVLVVAFNDQLIADGLPSITEYGQGYIPVGQPNDPTSGPLTLYYARAPIQPTAAGDSVDPFFPSFFDDFLMFDIAAYLADKDQRADDAQAFLGMKSAHLTLIVEWVRAQTMDVQQRFPLVSPPLTNENGGRQPAAPGAA